MDETRPLHIPAQALPGRPPWVGREAELAVLRGLLSDVVRGVGGSVLVEGPPGIGKSSLVSEAVRAAGACQVLVLRGSADEFCTRLPFQLITEALRPVRGTEPVPGTGSLWGAGARDPLVTGVQLALARVERACAAQPMVLIASDLQWADDASLTVLGSLLRLTAQLPLLLVGELTTGSQRDEVRQLRRTVTSRGATAITLGPLSRRESERLAEGYLGLPLSADLRRLTAQTGGNPFHVRELTAALLRERCIGVREEQAQLLPGPEGGDRLPTSLGASIADRLGYLSEDTLEVLRAASVLGTSFEVGELSAVLGWPLQRVIAALGEATATGVLGNQGTAVAFHAPLLRQALYESMTTAARDLRHRRSAQVLSEAGWPPERVAAQLDQVLGAADQWTLNWLTESGTALLYRVPQLAVDLLQQATEGLARDDERRESLEAVLAMAAFLSGRLEECENIATRVLAHTEDPERAAEMTWILGYTLLHQSRRGEAIEAVTGAASRWPLPPVWQARLCALHGVILNAEYDTEHREITMQVLRKALDLGRNLKDAQTIAYAANAMWTLLYLQKEFDACGPYLDEGLAVASSDPQLTDVRLMLLCNKMTHLRSSDIIDERAWATARTARKAATEAGTARISVVLGLTASLAYFGGAWDDALADLEAVDEWESDGFTAVIVKGLFALIKVRRGDLEAARVDLAEIGDPDTMSPSAHVNSTNLWHAHLALADREGRHDEVRALLQPFLSEEFRALMEDHHRILPLGLRLAQRAGDTELAAALLAAAHHAADQDERAVVGAAARQCQGLFAVDPEPLREALAYFRDSPWTVDTAECAEDLAVVLARTGDLEAARTAMREAAEIYLSLGAAGDLDRADARWREAGLRRGAQGARKRPASGRESLTPTEQRVAELVAEGLSNPDIAERLFSSRRTIQTHVTHILAKLGLRSRNEVAHAIADRPQRHAAS